MVSDFEKNWILAAATLIELAAAAVIGCHAFWAALLLIRRQGQDRARMVVADGVLAGLGFSLAGTLLKTIGLQSWSEIRMFLFVFMFRTLLKRIFSREKRLIAARLQLAKVPQG